MAIYGPLEILFTRRYQIVKELIPGYTGNKKLTSELFVSGTSRPPSLRFGGLRQRTLLRSVYQPELQRRLVEVSGFEPLTPCLQSRCSSS